MKQTNKNDFPLIKFLHFPWWKRSGSNTCKIDQIPDMVFLLSKHLHLNSFPHLLMICEYRMLQPYNNKNLVIMFNTLVYCLVAARIVLRLLAIRILFKWNCQLLESDKRPSTWPAVSYKANCCLYPPWLYFNSKLWLVVFPPSKHTWPHWTFISCNFSMRFYMCCNLKHGFQRLPFLSPLRAVKGQCI